MDAIFPLPEAAHRAPPIAAVLYDHGDPVEELLATVAQALRRESVRVAGLLQHSVRDQASARCVIDLENIDTGRRYPLTQNLGIASQSCALDITALAEASSVLRQAVADHAQMVLINKFGTQEVNGRGLRSEMMEIAMAGIPILTSVGRRYLPQWREFIGGEAALLPMSVPAVLGWWQQVRRVHAPA
jgi:nucleoside-triphosphatase THEP1